MQTNSNRSSRSLTAMYRRRPERLRTELWTESDSGPRPPTPYPDVERTFRFPSPKSARSIGGPGSARTTTWTLGTARTSSDRSTSRTPESRGVRATRRHALRANEGKARALCLAPIAERPGRGELLRGNLPNSAFAIHTRDRKHAVAPGVGRNCGGGGPKVTRCGGGATTVVGTGGRQKIGSRQAVQAPEIQRTFGTRPVALFVPA